MLNTELNPATFTASDALIDLAAYLPQGGLHVKHDPKTGLIAIIALYSTQLGPALGGCRMLEYTSVRHAILDAIRLAQGMAYKSAAAGLPLGGGKGVIVKPRVIKNREAFLKAYALFVDQLGGNYITAMDSGTCQEDMNTIAKYTKFVTCYAGHDMYHGDPAPYTALGVLKGIEAAVHYKLKQSSLAGLHVAIQGVGNVGFNLVKLLHEQGVKLTVADVNVAHSIRCRDAFGAHIVGINEIYGVECDVFSPCALGGIINCDTINLFNTKIIAGAANNQLHSDFNIQKLQQKNILYAPDFIISAGGVAFAYSQYEKHNQKEALATIDKIYHALLTIFHRSEVTNKDPQQVALLIARNKLGEN